MKRVLLGALAICLLVALVACGETSTSSDSGAGTNGDAASWGEPVTVGPLKVTPTDTRSSGIGEIDESMHFEAENGAFFAVRMRWENLTDAPITEFPTAQIVTDSGTTYEVATISDPTPSLVDNMFDFTIPPGAAKEGWLTFDIAGTPKTLYVYMTGDDSEPETGSWVIPAE